MREIKFRAWIAEERRMTPGLNLIGIQSWPNKLIESAPIMQYTGLKDKNGKEIYEGDLYSAWDERSYYAVEWNEKTAGFQLVWVKGDVGDSKTRHYFDMLMAEYQFEPVGNIYENPELLTSSSSLPGEEK